MKTRIIASTVVFAVFAAIVVAGIWSSRRQPLGVRDGRLLPCPASPNCVSSFEYSDEDSGPASDHGIKPIPFTGTPQQALDAVTQVMASLPRTTLLARKTNYARFAVRSARLGFIDDVEFLVVGKQVTGRQLQFRSASRLGYGDLGVNRARLTLVSQELRERLAKLGT